MRVILGPVPCHACEEPVIWAQTGESFGWRDAPSANFPGIHHHCRPFDMRRKQQIAARLLFGVAYSDIADEFGITKQRVGQIAQRLRDPVRRRPGRPRQEAVA